MGDRRADDRDRRDGGVQHWRDGRRRTSPRTGTRRLNGATRAQVARALTLESFVTTLVGIAVAAAVVLASLARAGSDLAGGPLVVPWDQDSLVVAGAAALGLVGTLVPAALVGRAPLTAHAGQRE